LYAAVVLPGGNWLALLSLSAAFGVDQALKSLVLNRGRVVAVGSPVRIEPVGGRLTMAGRAGASETLLLLAWLLLLLAMLAAGGRTGLFDTPASQAALGAALGGAAGNLYDVVVRKGVVDYVRLGPWPRFNLADVAIVAGIVVALVGG
jgi:lipoprotein signal peptidase